MFYGVQFRKWFCKKASIKILDFVELLIFVLQEKRIIRDFKSTFYYPWKQSQYLSWNPSLQNPSNQNSVLKKSVLSEEKLVCVLIFNTLKRGILKVEHRITHFIKRTHFSLHQTHIWLWDNLFIHRKMAFVPERS